MSYDNRTPREIRILNKDAIFIENINPCRYLNKIEVKTGFQMRYLGTAEICVYDDYFNVHVDMRYCVHNNDPRDIDELLSVSIVSEPYGRSNNDYVIYFFSKSMQIALANKILNRLDSMGFYDLAEQRSSIYELMNNSEPG